MSNNTKQKTVLNNGMTFLGEVPKEFKVKHTWHSHDKRPTVKVVHKWDVESNNDGTMKVDGKRKFSNSARAVIQRVVHKYIDGRVSTNTGDVWDVIPNKDKREAQFVTVKGEM